ncbi:hemolysin family protein [Chrysiogenes arsenatis]|uniref:hemolysin family protein n=1 Tax=Chrysiogenes arsenatis TaxID=309797 RepID=UPI0003FC0859|nr:hemolysin family protein [Chrysiogenes arsenatis]
MESALYFESIILFLCLIFSGMFSGSETALTSLSTLKCRHIIEVSNGRANALRIWLRHPNRILTTILIGNNLVNILGSAVATGVAIDLFGSVGIGIATGIMTLIILVIGELIPKTFAKHNAERLALPAIKFLLVIYFTLYPLVLFFTWLTTTFISLSGGKTEHYGPGITEEEIEYIINASSEEGVIHMDKSDMLSSIFEFSATIVKEVMLPKPHVFMLSADLPFNEIVSRIIERGHSRIPIFRGSDDNIVGILFAKDLLKVLRDGTPVKDFSIEKLLRKPIYVPEVKKVDALFQEFKEKRFHFALVVDEYGSFSGIVSMEDLLEEIVGEIRDEYDIREKDLIKEIDGNNWTIDPRINIDDFKAFFDLEEFEHPLEKDGDFDSVGGLITTINDGLPHKGQHFIYGDFEFIVEEVDERKIKMLLFCRKDTSECLLPDPLRED